jgi:hypothetical protein
LVQAQASPTSTPVATGTRRPPWRRAVLEVYYHADAGNRLAVPPVCRDVASAVLALVGPAFAKTTGAQIPIDGGSDRVI